MINKIVPAKISLDQAKYYSNFQLLSLKQRIKGLKLDLDLIRNTIPKMDKEIEELRVALILKLKGIDPDKPKQVAKQLIQLGYTLPKSLKGGDSTNGKWLEQNKQDELLGLLYAYRTTKKIRDDFFIKPLKMQEETCPDALKTGKKYGKIFPDLNILGASATGRMSSSNPNQQNIPHRNEKYGNLCRSMFVPEDESNVWAKLDYSGQELKLNLYFSNQINAPGAKEAIQELYKNTCLDLHKYTYAKMFNLEYSLVSKEQKNFVKPINLGLNYGMGKKKLFNSLGLGWKKGIETLKLHKEAVPYAHFLIEYASKYAEKQGYVTTLASRRLYMPFEGRGYVAVNYKIQGSGADMIYKAFLELDKKGYDIKTIVHDEINIELKKDDKVIDKLKDIAYTMQNGYDLSLPMQVEISYGKSWGEQEEIKI